MIRILQRQVILALGLSVAGGIVPVSAWDTPGHMIVTRLAVEGLPNDFPDWVKSKEAVERLCYLCAEPDRWRGQGAPALAHINEPDHYIDVEDLDAFGMDLMHLPRFRNEFIETLATYRALHPAATPKGDATDTAHVRTVPGLLPYAIEELRWKTASSWSTLRTFEQFPDVVTPAELTGAHDNVLHYMGLLSHFVGDAHQPLHTTTHHHGWVGPNPDGFTTHRGFHQYIDGTVIERDHLSFATLKDQARPAAAFDAKDDWSQILGFIQQTHELVVPLYRLDKELKLESDEGKTFIADRLLDAGSNLAGLWVAAHQSSHIDPYMSQQLELRRAPATAPQEKDPPAP